jgi:hypothetical protein
MVAETAGDGRSYFRITHNPDYQRAERLFLSSLQSYDPSRTAAVLQAYPFHVQSLLETSRYLRESGDAQLAADFVDRALHVLERAFHPRFSLADGTCRLDYRQHENRPLFIALFMQAEAAASRGCWRCALELCKAYLSLDSGADPLGGALTCDFYALRAHDASWYLRFLSEWQAKRCLSLLPNTAFSAALALLRARGSELTSKVFDFQSEISRQAAVAVHADVLQATAWRNSEWPGAYSALDVCVSAMLLFPSLVPLIANKARVSLRVPFGSPTNDAGALSGLRMLFELYIARVANVWPDPDASALLNAAAERAAATVSKYPEVLGRYAELRRTSFVGCPESAVRHAMLLECRPALTAVPTALRARMGYDADPLPPMGSMCAYSLTMQVRVLTLSSLRAIAAHQQRHAQHDAGPEAPNEGLLMTLARSFLPSFTPTVARPAASNERIGIAEPLADSNSAPDWTQPVATTAQLAAADSAAVGDTPLAHPSRAALNPAILREVQDFARAAFERLGGQRQQAQQQPPNRPDWQYNPFEDVGDGEQRQPGVNSDTDSDADIDAELDLE